VRYLACSSNGSRMQRGSAGLLILLWFGSCILVASAYPQPSQDETLSGQDSHETGQGPHGHLFGDWGGERSRLSERGVRVDFQCVSDSLTNFDGAQKDRFASWNRFRWTVDVDFGALVGQHGSTLCWVFCQCSFYSL
jgi:porin